ncbi:unnamed protein product [Sphenostylis stenocarpa]|uniref:Uncharacterized protein n=1 Tax=Sphenostylis stenocarpa TaxID=92480 RepID=A0AA86RQ21_9FABA|nr:unnamed protein product [Sphenostylis stenocarpa]
MFTDQVERMKIMGRWFSRLRKRRKWDRLRQGGGGDDCGGEERLGTEGEASEDGSQWRFSGGADGSWRRVRESGARWLVEVGERWLAGERNSQWWVLQDEDGMARKRWCAVWVRRVEVTGEMGISSLKSGPTRCGEKLENVR